MSWLYDLKIRTKLLVSFALLAFIAAVVGIVSVTSIDRMSASDKELYAFHTVPIEKLAEGGVQYQLVRISLRDALLAEKGAAQTYVDAVHEHHKAVETRLAEMEKLIQTDDVRKEFATVAGEFKTYASWEDKVANCALAGDDKGGFEVLQSGAYKDSTKIIAGGIQKLQDMMGEASKKKSESNVASATTVKWIVALLVLVGIGLAISLGTVMSKIIATPLYAAVNVSNELAAGDLTSSIEVKGKDETAQLLVAMKGMASKLREMILGIKSAAETVASASQELKAGSESMSEGIAEQSHRATQIATASAQMSHTVIDIARSASGMATAAHDATRVAGEGSAIVDRSVDEVKTIAETVSASAKIITSLGERSRQIGAIVNVIEDIADQTNLLALNAAIEAARAGEQGRGFAVVADEVRKLAERTAKATSEIGKMINAVRNEVGQAVLSMDKATKQVDIGAQDITKAGDALSQIVESVNNLQSMVQQIASATEEMSTASENISTDIETIARVSGETSSSSIKMTQGASNLSTLSSDLQHVVDQFRI